MKLEIEFTSTNWSENASTNISEVDCFKGTLKHWGATNRDVLLLATLPYLILNNLHFSDDYGKYHGLIVEAQDF